MEPDHVRQVLASLNSRLARQLSSDAFAAQCDEVFRRADVNGSGFIKNSHACSEIAAVMHNILPDVFLDRLELEHAEIWR